MPQRLRQTIKFKNLNLPVSYNSDVQGKMRDARNVFSNKDRLDTRHGCQRWNAVQIGSGEDVTSVSYFKKTDGSIFNIVKSGTTLYSVSETGAHTTLKTGLTAGTKHRAVTFSDRHIITIDTDGTFSFDGTTFTQLGQDAYDGVFSVAVSGAGNTLPSATYEVAFTYYSTTTGFESNLSLASSEIAVTLGEQIDITAMPNSAFNETINRKRIYLRDVTNAGVWLFIEEINLSLTLYSITESSSSSITPPTKHAKPLGSGAKYVEAFGDKIVLSGVDGFESDVLFSESYLPDAFDDSSITRLVFRATGNGPVTGIKVGYYTSDNLSPYLCIFKRASIDIYSNIGGASYSTISTQVGSVSQDTIQEIDGNIYFMSESGWHTIANGRLLEKSNQAYRLGGGDIDSIFTEEGFVYELNQANTENFFSVYYQRLNQYITFISESGSTIKNKAYNYEFDIQGFRPYEFPIGYTDGCISEGIDGESFVLLGGEDGYLYKHGIGVSKHDVDGSNTSVNVDVFAQMYWISHDDFDATMNFGTLILKGLDSDSDITAKFWLNYNISDSFDLTYSFSGPKSGFILDESFLDVGVFGDSRDIYRSVGQGIYKTSQSLLVGFYQNALDSNMGLMSCQIDASKNGNVN